MRSGRSRPHLWQDGSKHGGMSKSTESMVEVAIYPSKDATEQALSLCSSSRQGSKRRVQGSYVRVTCSRYTTSYIRPVCNVPQDQRGPVRVGQGHTFISLLGFKISSPNNPLQGRRPSQRVRAGVRWFQSNLGNDDQFSSSSTFPPICPQNSPIALAS